LGSARWDARRLAPEEVQLIPVDVEGQRLPGLIVGHPRYGLRIGKAKVGSAKVFRLEGWKGALGTRFEEV
jgi:hypothetical protein